MVRNEGNDAKSCVPQLFAEGEPSNEWGLEELGVYAQMQYRQILDGERLLAPAYWRLGRALKFAKKAFRHGKWSQYVKDLGIDKTRASKAGAIYRTFDGPDDVAKCTVEQAYAKRQRKQSANPEDGTDGAVHPREDVRRLRKFVSSISKRTEDVIHDAAFAAPEEAVILIPAVQKTIRQLEELLKYLEQQADAAPADAIRDETQQEETAGST